MRRPVEQPHDDKPKIISGELSTYSEGRSHHQPVKAAGRNQLADGFVHQHDDMP
jgi:hypothetical protein